MQHIQMPNLEVATPERVALALPVAGVGFRALAYLLDLGMLALGWTALYFTLTLLVSDLVGFLRDLSGWVQTTLVVLLFALEWMYWTLCEVLFDGQSLGKRWVGIRVIRTDGSPVGFFESAIRNLCRAVDFLPGCYGAGLTCMLVDRHHRRLGDLAAGTLLVRQQKFDLTKYLPHNPSSSTAPSDSELSATDLELVLAFLERLPHLSPDSRWAIASALVHRLGGERAPKLIEQAQGRSEPLAAWLRERTSFR